MLAIDQTFFINTKRCTPLEHISLNIKIGKKWPIKGVLYWNSKELHSVHPLVLYPDLKDVFDIQGVLVSEKGEVLTWLLEDCEIVSHKEDFLSDEYESLLKTDTPAFIVTQTFKAKNYSPPAFCEREEVAGV